MSTMDKQAAIRSRGQASKDASAESYEMPKILYHTEIKVKVEMKPALGR